MVRSCKVCKMEKTPLVNRHLFSFPKKAALREKWCRVLGYAVNEIRHYDAVCHEHFDKESFRVGGSRIFLTKNAVPFPQRSQTEDNTESTSNASVQQDKKSELPVPIRMIFLREDFTSAARYNDFLAYQKYLTKKLQNASVKASHYKSINAELKELVQELKEQSQRM